MSAGSIPVAIDFSTMDEREPVLLTEEACCQQLRAEADAVAVAETVPSSLLCLSEGCALGDGEELVVTFLPF